MHWSKSSVNSHVLALYAVDQSREAFGESQKSKRPRDFNVTQMKADKVVLLGSFRANPWEDLIQGRLNFHFGYDKKSKEGYFENRDRRPGEPKFYRCDSLFRSLTRYPRKSNSLETIR